MILFFDTETTGKADFRAPIHADHQPWLVQLAAVLADDDLNIRHRFSAIVKPDGWTIPDEAARVHGITTEIATKWGFPLVEVLGTLANLAGPTKLRVAHNLNFDDRVLATNFHRRGLINPFKMLDDLTGRFNGFCTMEAMTDICQLPGPYGYKWPKLTEAFSYCVGRPMMGAHDAMADVLGCLEVYRWLDAKKKAASSERTVTA